MGCGTSPRESSPMTATAIVPSKLPNNKTAAPSEPRFKRGTDRHRLNSLSVSSGVQSSITSHVWINDLNSLEGHESLDEASTNDCRSIYPPYRVFKESFDEEDTGNNNETI